MLIAASSCRKNDVVNDAGKRPGTESNFFDVSLIADAEIRKLAADLERQNNETMFMPDFVRKNGMPRWDKVLYHVGGKKGGAAPGGASLHDGLTQPNGSESANDPSRGIFLLPLQQQATQRISAYVVAYKHNDTLYSYRLYHRDTLSAIQPTTLEGKNDLVQTQAVFGYFEHAINGVDSINISSPLGATLKHASISFEEMPNNDTAGTRPLSLVSPSSGTCGSFVIRTVIRYDIQVVPLDADGLASRLVVVPVVTTQTIAVSCDGDEGGGIGGFWYYFGSGWPYASYDPTGGGGIYDGNWNFWWTGGGGGGYDQSLYDMLWFNSSPDFSIDISSDDIGPCGKEVIAKLFESNNTVIKFIREKFSESTKFNIKFELDATLPVHARALTPADLKYESRDNGYLKFSKISSVILIKPAFLNNSTKMGIAQAILHELIHVYFHYRQAEAHGDPLKLQKFEADFGFLKPFNNNSFGIQNLHHDQMASSYINLIAAALKEYKLISEDDLDALRNSSYPSLTIDGYYEALAWAGLLKTESFQKLKVDNPTKAAMIEFIISAEENGTSDAPSKMKCP